MMINKQQLLPAIAAFAFAAGSAQAATLFYDNFDGSGGLNATTPDVTTGATWVAGSVFNANGTTGDTAGSATLAWTPTAGSVYQLDASFSNLGLANTATNPENDWVALGFGNGQSTANGTNDRFITGNVVGSAWMLARGDLSGKNPDTFAWLGTGQLGGGNNGLSGGNAPLEVATGSEIDLRIILDTTAGASVTDWTATWLAKTPADGSYSVVRTENLLAGTTIGSVGIARSNAGITGTVESFSLTTVIPSPTAALAGLVGLAGLGMRRRRGQ